MKLFKQCAIAGVSQNPLQMDGFSETPALAECLNNFIFLKVASREVWLVLEVYHDEYFFLFTSIPICSIIIYLRNAPDFSIDTLM